MYTSKPCKTFGSGTKHRMVTPICCKRWLKERGSPEQALKLLKKGEGFGTKHAGGLNANGDKVVCGRQVCIFGLLLLFCLLCHHQSQALMVTVWTQNVPDLLPESHLLDETTCTPHCIQIFQA